MYTLLKDSTFTRKPKMKILVTGGSGMVGSAFKKVNTSHELKLLSRTDADLLEQDSFLRCLDRESPDAVIHLAAKVGGVKGNTDFVADFYSENVRMNCNVLDSCNRAGVEKVVSLLSTCVYPDDVQYPLTEDQIHNGQPHESNFGYAYAKRMLDVHSRALRQQYGRNYVCAVPNNLYGINDNFDLENGHVIPAIIRKLWEAKQSGNVPVFWGDGTPLREFTFSEDVAESLIFILEKYDSADPINIGSGEENSISSVVEIIKSLVEYEGEIIWDTSMPSGQYKKPSSNSRFVELGWDEKRYTPLEAGLKKTVSWFIDSYPNVRGL